MCRRTHLWGCCALCLGLGFLIGRGLESGLLALCLGLGLICLGVGCFRLK